MQAPDLGAPGVRQPEPEPHTTRDGDDKGIAIINEVVRYTDKNRRDAKRGEIQNEMRYNVHIVA